MSSRGPYDSKGFLEAEPRSLGERLRRVRIQWGWTQLDLAQALNTDQTVVSNWERDRSVPSGAAMGALCTLLKTTPSAMETGEDFLIAPEPPLPTPSAPTLTLPPRGDLPIVLLDVKQAQTKEADLQDVLEIMLQAIKDNRGIWVVLE